MGKLYWSIIVLWIAALAAIVFTAFSDTANNNKREIHACDVAAKLAGNAAHRLDTDSGKCYIVTQNKINTIEEN